MRGERPGLTLWEQLLRWAGALLALISTGFAVWYLVKGFVQESEYPYVVNSVAKDSLLAGLSLLVFWDVRRWAAVAVPLIVIAHTLMPIVMLLTAWWGEAEGIDHTWIGPPSSASEFRMGWIAADIGVVIAFTVLHWKAVRSRYDMRYLPPSAFRALMALAEVLVLREDREITPAEVAVRVDHYLASFRARREEERPASPSLGWPTGRCSPCGRRSTSCRRTSASAGCSGASSTRSRTGWCPGRSGPSARA